ncbi:MAG: hypothetical protein M3546_14615 [Actinomycetota bacterium]|nr:hypothetical protein [Actinomycetota bacterium]
MARARPAQAPTPDQLTLEDWAEMLKASPVAPDTPRREAADVDPAAPPAAAENGEELQGTCAEAAIGGAVRHHPVATELLETPGALLTRTHLRELGLERRAVDAVFRELPVVTLPGYSRPMIHVEQYLELIGEHTYRDDRVRPRHA